MSVVLRPTGRLNGILLRRPQIRRHSTSSTDRIAKLINDHPFPSTPLLPFLHRHLSFPPLTPSFLESLLARLFAGHANVHKAAEVFRFSLHHPSAHLPTPRAFDTALHIAVRGRDFALAWTLLEEAKKHDPSLITNKSLSIVISKYAKFRSFEETMAAFERMEGSGFLGKEFGVAEFNVLVRAFCVERKVMEARTVVRKFRHRFTPDTKTLNAILLGFKETKHLMAMDLFYHDAVLRGFCPNVVSYNIRIEAYCKKRRISVAMEIFEEMRERGFEPTLETMTILIHGACVTRNPSLARRLFDEIVERNLTPDVVAYNALLSAMVRSKDVRSGVELMEEMDGKGVCHDNITYYTMFWGMKKYGCFEDVEKLFRKMMERNVLPNARTVILLMRYFCESREADFGLELWRYVLDKGCCPHGHAMDLLVTALCCGGKVDEAFQCFRQVVDRGRHPSERGFAVLEGFLMREGREQKVKELVKMLKALQRVVPPTKGHALYALSSKTEIC